MSLFNELKRRNVFRVAIAYLAAAWLLTEVAGTLFPMFGYGDAPARIVVILLVIGFPLFLAFSWLYELTPEGLKLEKDVDRTGPAPRAGTTRLDRVIIVLLALAVGYFAFDKFVIEPRRVAEIVEETAQQARSEALVESYGESSIAVLPFVNLSADPEQEYFSDGISEELLNLLGRIPELRVISRSSSFYYKGKDVKLADLARELNVAHVLEGSVRKAGDRVRITAQLIEARSDTHLWSDTFDRDLDDIFAVQDEIAREIGAALKVKFALTDTTPAPSVIPSASVDAYDIYLKGRAAVRHRNGKSLREAVRHFKHALRLDAKFAPAHAQLAIATLLQVQVGASTLEDAKLAAAPHVEKALELEPDLVDAQHAIALLEIMKLNPKVAMEHAQRALALNPNYVDAQTILANALYRLGRYREAEEAYRQVTRTDPLNIMGLVNYAERLNQLGRNKEVHEIANRLLELSSSWGYFVHARTSFLYEGNIAEGLEWTLRQEGVGPFATFIFLCIGEYEEARRLGRASIWVDMYEGRYDEAIERSQRAMQRDPDNTGKITDAANVLYSVGRIDEALPLLEKALELGPDGRPIVAHLDHLLTMMLAEARRHAGNEQGAEAVASIVREDHAARVAAGQQHVNLDIWGSMVAAFDGDYDAAIAYLESAVTRGLRDKIAFTEPMYEPFSDDPRFLAVQVKLDNIRAKEHEEVLQLICFNNPAPDNWRPMPETCEGVEKQRDP